MPGTRPWIPGLAVFVATAGLFAEPAFADQRMFRVSLRFLGAAGSFSRGLHPPLSTAACGPLGSMGNPVQCPPAEAGSTSPVARFTIPPKVLQRYYIYSYTGYAGYTSLSTLSSYNGRGHFQPSNPHGASAYRRLVFPTTMGNPGRNRGSGNPVTPTTTFGGDFDFDRAGVVKITPGPNRFGGTLQLLFGPNAAFAQRIRTVTNYYSRAYGSFSCQATAGSGPGARNGPLQACTISGTSKIGVIGSSGLATRHKYTGLGYVPIKTTGGVNDLTYKAYYLYTFAPWTTGMLYAINPLSRNVGKLTWTGYDQKFLTPTTRTFTYRNFNTTPEGTTTTTSMKTLMGITRITSLIRPRLRHAYRKSNEPRGIVTTHYQATEMWGLNVYFLPEPGMTMLMGGGILAVVGLSALRRR